MPARSLPGSTHPNNHMIATPASVRRARDEPVALCDYDPAWPQYFEQEASHLRQVLPHAGLGRIAHFGSTAVPGLVAKPIVDMLVEVPSLRSVQQDIAPVLEKLGYEFFWRASWRDNLVPEYTWFIKRDERGRRTHHIHMLTSDAPEWERLLFRDYLIAHPQEAAAYGALKRRLVLAHPGDRIAYARAKSDFIDQVMHKARQAYSTGRNGR